MRPFKLLLDLLYPPKCPFCGRVLERGEEGWCAACQRDLPWTEPGEGKAVEGCALCLSPCGTGMGCGRACTATNSAGAGATQPCLER